MNRLTRINTIWRKELIDTLRDRRTLIAMILVPMVLYPAMMLGSLQAFEFQFSRLKQQTYIIAVPSEELRLWLRTLLDTDTARHPGATGRTAEEILEAERSGELAPEAAAAAERERSAEEAARADVARQPPPYEVVVIPEPERLKALLRNGDLHVGLLADPVPSPRQALRTTEMTLLFDDSDIRSQIAATGLQGVLARYGQALLQARLEAARLAPSFIKPLELRQESVATAEKVGGSILGQIVPLILIIMTITGAIYPAIDLTAGERERGTLETLMVAPVPTLDLIAGKFVVVTLIALLSAVLNLLSIGGTVYLGGLGEVLSRGGNISIPLHVLPLVLLVLIPLAVMFSAALLAVCSFARSFKEAQNYVMPVMIAALIPAVVGILPGTELSGPLLIMPVANVVILTRDLFMDRIDVVAMAWVLASTLLYAGAAVTIAAKLFGQEAVLFADSGSIKTIFQRRFFKPLAQPTAAQAMLLLAVTFTLNFLVQQQFAKIPGIAGTAAFFWCFAALLVVLLVLLPVGFALYTRVRLSTTFSLGGAPLVAWVAALCFGFSTWILARAWQNWQQQWLTLPPEVIREAEVFLTALMALPLPLLLLFMAVVPAITEELFFRGYALNGLRSGVGKVAAVLIVTVAFAMNHHSAHRLVVTAALGLLFALLVLRYHSVWPAVLAHLLHNAISLLPSHPQGKELVEALKIPIDAEGLLPDSWVVVAAALTLLGIALCLFPRHPRGDWQSAAVLPDAS